MDLGSVPNRLISMAEKHAFALTFLGTAVARASEQSQSDPIGALVGMLNPLQDPGLNGAGPVHELLSDIGMLGGNPLTNLKWKLWDAPHIPTMAFKLSTGLWIAAKLGIPYIEKYEQVLAKVAKGSALAALMLPGSGPMSGNTATIPNAVPGAQSFGSYSNLSNNPTTGGLYTTGTQRFPTNQ